MSRKRKREIDVVMENTTEEFRESLDKLRLSCKPTTGGRGVHKLRSRAFCIKDKTNDIDFEAIFVNQFNSLVWQERKDGTTMVGVRFKNPRSLEEVYKQIAGIPVRTCDWRKFVHNFHPDHPGCNGELHTAGVIRHPLSMYKNRQYAQEEKPTESDQEIADHGI
jgi:hypothetical protein